MGIPTRITIFTPLLFALAGCFGSGNDEALPGLDDPRTIALLEEAKGSTPIQNLNGAAAAVDDILEAAAMDSAPAAARVGTANYQGSFVAGDDEVANLGDLSLSANFGTGTLTGTVTNIRQYDTQHPEEAGLVNGELNLTGTIASNSLTAEVDGATWDDEERFAVTGTLNGDFRGSDAEVVAAVGVLNIVGDSGERETMEAGFSADRVNPVP